MDVNMNKKYTHTNEFTDLKPCLDYIYKNFGSQVFFSGRLTAYVKDLGPSIAECSVIRILEKENILNQIESICSIDVNERNILIDDIIYKLPIHLNKEAFRNTLEIIILSLDIDSRYNKNNIQENNNINTDKKKSNVIQSKDSIYKNLNFSDTSLKKSLSLIGDFIIDATKGMDSQTREEFIDKFFRQRKKEYK